MSDASADDSAALDESAPARDSSHYVILALLWAGVAGMVALHFFASPAAARSAGGAVAVAGLALALAG